MKAERVADNTVLGERFRIVKFLGAGSFGEVYWARQLAFGHPMRDVALKLFSPELANAKDYFDTFSDAVTLVRLLESGPPDEVSQRMVHVYDVGVLPVPAADDTVIERPFMSMKLIEGGLTLEDAVMRFRNAGGMPVSLSMDYMRQLLIPLGWMHTQPEPALHCDIKPDNILLSADKRRVILTDFGLAKRFNLGAQGGAVAYQAPEQLAQASHPGPQADVYAAGLVWYELLTGTHPFVHVGREELANDDTAGYLEAQRQARKWEMRPALDASDQQRIVPPSELNDDLKQHPQVELLVRQCLDSRASRRPVHGRALLEQIDKYVNEGKIDLPTGEAMPRPKVPDLPSEPNPKSAAKSPQMLVHDAIALLESGRADEALVLLDQASQQQPDSLDATLARARALTVLGRQEQAYGLLSAAQKKYPKTVDVLEAMADFYEQCNNPAGAERLRAKIAKQRLR
ncbi:MAG: protein kinase [Planctomycetales bacterium]|nr:protein kinase [Planctomycetales bacterium]